MLISCVDEELDRDDEVVEQSTPPIASVKLHEMIAESCRSIPAVAMWQSEDFLEIPKLELVAEEDDDIGDRITKPEIVEDLPDSDVVFADEEPTERMPELFAETYDPSMLAPKPQLPPARLPPPRTLPTKVLPAPLPVIDLPKPAAKRVGPLVERKSPRSWPADSAVAAVIALFLFGGVTLGIEEAMHHDYSTAPTNGSPQLTQAEVSPSPTLKIDEPIAVVASPPAPTVDRPNPPPLTKAAISTAKSSTQKIATTPKRTESEQLSADADAEMQRGDYAAATNDYNLALASNPDYLPARLGVADAAWARGDLALARASYAKIAESYPSDMLPNRVFER